MSDTCDGCCKGKWASVSLNDGDTSLRCNWCGKEWRPRPTKPSVTFTDATLPDGWLPPMPHAVAVMVEYVSGIESVYRSRVASDAEYLRDMIAAVRRIFRSEP